MGYTGADNVSNATSSHGGRMHRSVRICFLVLVAPLYLASCASVSDDFAGLTYKAGRAQFMLQPGCVDRIEKSESGRSIGVFISIKPGRCQDRFVSFMASHMGQRLTVYFGHEEISGPSKIVGKIKSPFIQHVGTFRQATIIQSHYRRLRARDGE